MTVARVWSLPVLLALEALAGVRDPRVRPWDPPSAYDHPYAGRMVVRWVPLAEIRRMRPGHGATGRYGRGGACIAACAGAFFLRLKKLNLAGAAPQVLVRVIRPPASSCSRARLAARRGRAPWRPFLRLLGAEDEILDREYPFSSGTNAKTHICDGHHGGRESTVVASSWVEDPIGPS